MKVFTIKSMIWPSLAYSARRVDDDRAKGPSSLDNKLLLYIKGTLNNSDLENAVKLEKDKLKFENQLGDLKIKKFIIQEQLPGLRDELEFLKTRKNNNTDPSKIKIYESQISSFEEQVSELKIDIKSHEDEIKKIKAGIEETLDCVLSNLPDITKRYLQAMGISNFEFLNAFDSQNPCIEIIKDNIKIKHIDEIARIAKNQIAKNSEELKVEDACHCKD